MTELINRGWYFVKAPSIMPAKKAAAVGLAITIDQTMTALREIIVCFAPVVGLPSTRESRNEKKIMKHCFIFQPNAKFLLLLRVKLAFGVL